LSVAFRRESDEEHKEPRFELPIPPGPNLVTSRGLALIEARVVELEAAVAREDTPEALEADRRTLRYWRTRLATARIAPPPPEGEAAIGARIVFRLKGETRTVDIVGGDEADPVNDRLAFSAPLARALSGAMAGDSVDFAGEADAMEIIEVGPIDD